MPPKSVLEAAGNRLATLSEDPVVFLVLEWGHKPADRPAMRRGENVPERLRVRYAVVQGLSLYLPKFKSAEESSPFVRALEVSGIERGTDTFPGGPPRLAFRIEAKNYPRSTPRGNIDRVLAIARPTIRQENP